MIEDIASAATMDELRALWREANRTGEARKLAVQRAKEQRKAELAEQVILANVEREFGPGAVIVARRALNQEKAA